MKTIILALTGLTLLGCASQPAVPPEELAKIQVFFEEPRVAYEELGEIEETSRGTHAMDTLDDVRQRAYELGANGVIVHSYRNMGRLSASRDAFGTGGGTGQAVYQIFATAIRYVDEVPADRQN